MALAPGVVVGSVTIVAMRVPDLREMMTDGRSCALGCAIPPRPLLEVLRVILAVGVTPCRLRGGRSVNAAHINPSGSPLARRCRRWLVNIFASKRLALLSSFWLAWNRQGSRQLLPGSL